ncbi:Cysteine-rich repeat secretory protein 3 [Vitis vinifera]|uniref:Cysteine-rich repeat secretory protein 3 n=1 Tax=Vitis vinifera TaxID=29760 RepID=A0A438CCK3_VITVI|nr:Cysteine-rich repeat secretory protein 3 [Vitis vinifera]
MVLFTNLELTPLAESATDYTALVYKGCAEQALSDPNAGQALSALFGSLVSQSTKAKFFKTTSGTGQTSITGLFQIQLYGCYILYEVAGFAQISGMKMLYKTCSATNVAGSGFEERRDTAFHPWKVACECVKSAVQRAQVECGSSISGQIYLHKCFISYSYYPNGVPRRSSSDSSSSSSSGTRQTTGKTVAIIVGGAAALGFVVICMLFARNLMKKHEDF